MTTKLKTDTDQIEILISGMKQEGYDFNENPAIFKWTLDEHPELDLTLMIQPKTAVSAPSTLQ